ncbi:cathepsin l [Plakobranchus ocellatus]|uniref:Cathepsin l n=1 Tax=Plakobranchus ocellatus TaxID=259542 RepID=A0AAV4BV37_9GAST|nr:cathepsin l [Plakobranchus ocellatus]
MHFKNNSSPILIKLKTGALEGQWFAKTEDLISLSEQQLIDCVDENNGCKGGTVLPAFEHIINTGGIATDANYPYRATTGTCHFNASKISATAYACGVVEAHRRDEELKIAVATIGPLSISIDADSPHFKHYTRGVYDNPSCSSVRTNHAALVVGYGSEGGQDYWIVKNSWGTSWGIHGYILMSRNKDNQCGIANVPSFPLV